MNREGFLLGFFATGGQVLLLRELVSSLNGDELLIGTALFGWLIWVACGAYVGGKVRLPIRAVSLFIAGAVILPLTIIITRLSPLVATDIVGEAIPFSTSAFISIIVMLPVGIIAGWLFPSISRERSGAFESIIQVYLFEGLGACIGGVSIVLLVGSLFSTLGMSIAISVIAICGNLISFRKGITPRVILIGLTAPVLTVLILLLGPCLEAYIDAVKYKSYSVLDTFDTPYSHQTLLRRDSTLVLLTDNTIEGVLPDLQTAENLFIPYLAYKPDARRILVIGRSEMGMTQLAEKMPDVSITAVDPREKLTQAFNRLVPVAKNVLQVNDDPMAFFSRAQRHERFDILIIILGDLASYKNSRLLTDEFLTRAKSLLERDGCLYLATHYDTDRYISSAETEILSVVFNVLKHAFTYVTFWPGNMTLMFASDAPLFDVPRDSAIQRVSRLAYCPQFINEDYLDDRLSELKMQRLRAAVNSFDETNSIVKPTLPYYQAAFRARANRVDRTIVSLILKKPAWVIAVPALVISFFVMTLATGGRRKHFGMFLYFVAGLVSLTSELLSFYIYQSTAGSLYAEMAVLIGAFMLGLAVGTYFAYRWGKGQAEYAASYVLLGTTLIFLFTYRAVFPQILLLYHILFLFMIALGTGSLFVAATQRYYVVRAKENVGSGYAFELVGSAAGALLPMTVLLPVIGLHWLLLSLIVTLMLAFVGSVLTAGRGQNL